MSWLTWRLHRVEVAIGLPLFVGLIVIMLLAGGAVEGAYDAVRDGGCAGDDATVSGQCNELWDRFYSLRLNWDRLTVLLHGVPLMAAALLAIPTAQELERGTHRLAWTQTLSRRKWIVWRFGFVLGVAALVAALWIPVAAVWRDQVIGQEFTTFDQSVFDLSPTVLIGYGVFAAALALTAAVVVRRMVPTLVITAMGFIGLRIVTAFWLRERFRPPVEETLAAGSDQYGQFASFANRWILDETWLSSTGARMNWNQVYDLCPPNEVNVVFVRCLDDNGLQYFRSYQPTDRFAQFQFIELGLYVGLAALLLGFSYWWLTRRSA